MNKTVVVALAAGLAAVSACSPTAREQAADNLEARADGVADNMDAIAANEGAPISDRRENQADEVRDHADNEADAIRNGSMPMNGM